MKILKIILSSLAIVTSFFIFITILFLMLVTTTKNLLTKENLANYIKDANVLNMDANAIFDFKTEGTLNEKISTMALDVGIPKEIVQDILKSEEINELLGDYFGQIIRFIFNEEKPVLSNETIDKITNVAIESLNNHINIMMEEEELELLIVEYTDELINLVPEKTEIVSEETLSVVQQITSYKTIYLYIIIIVLVIITGVLTLSFYKPIQFLGFSMFLSGTTFVILGSLDSVINNYFTSKIVGMEAVLGPLVTNVLTLWFKCGVVVSFGGLLLIIIYVMIRRANLHTKRYG